MVTFNALWPRLHKNMSSDATNLGHVSDQTQGDVWESLMEVSAHHVDPRKAVPCVGVCFIQSHDVSEVGEFGILLLKTHLHRKMHSC